MQILTKRQSDIIIAALRARDAAEARVQELIAAAGAQDGDRVVVGPDGMVRFGAPEQLSPITPALEALPP